MATKVSELLGVNVRARDGVAGRLDDLFFDDRSWEVRFVVVRLGEGLHHRNVLLMPRDVSRSGDRRCIETGLSREEVAARPGACTHKPVSDQMKERFHSYLLWAADWVAGFYSPQLLAVSLLSTPLAEGDDGHLRSAHAVIGHHVMARDIECGRLRDFIVGDQSWRVVDLAVEQGRWTHKRMCLVSPYWVSEVSWTRSTVTFDLPRERIGGAGGDAHGTVRSA